MGNQHIHHNEIKAWADGETIEFFGKLNQKWITTKNPSWSLTGKYRVKPANPHQALMEEFAKGKVQIEVYRDDYCLWVYVVNPKWDDSSVYRIRQYDEGAFYTADYKNYKGIALRCGNGWKFIAPAYTGSVYRDSLTIHYKVMD